MLKELEQIFESVDKSILNEETLNKISTLVEESISTKVQLELESALKTQDENHALKFQQALNIIDKDHTAKVKAVVEHINKDHGKKLLFIEQKYKTVVEQTAQDHKNALVEAVNQFLDEEVLEKRIPHIQILEAAKNNYADKVLTEARKTLGIDEKFIKQNIKEGIIDGKKQMDKLIKENTDLRKSKLINESKKVLFEKTQNLPAAAARFVRTRLQNKTADYITANFDYVVEMFERSEKNAKTSALNPNVSQVNKSIVAQALVKETTENQVNNNTSDNSPMNVYMEGLNFRK